MSLTFAGQNHERDPRYGSIRRELGNASEGMAFESGKCPGQVREFSREMIAILLLTFL